MEPSDPLDSQWISIHIRDHLENRDINIRDSLVTPGDFHSPDDLNKQLTEESIDKMVIPSNGLGEVCATGRRGSEGWLDLFDGEKKICELHWDNRAEQYMNDFEVLDRDEQYKIECSGWSSVKGPLGHVFVDISEAEKKKEVKGSKERELEGSMVMEEVKNSV
ncbi:aegerolysin family protein [Aspergillus lucknowensis]|uniref:Aegerolysin-domain-containing protein n=1 Tax=Aspergillus lucknowensis TaxID=176173 RepID=A0ABR4LZW3_9EURO